MSPTSSIAQVRPRVATPLVSYVYGEAIPLPEVLDKNTDSVWAMWADANTGDPHASIKTIFMGLPDDAVRV